jgi:hypothetical protein
MHYIYDIFSFKKNNYTSGSSIKTAILNLNIETHTSMRTTPTLTHTHIFYGKRYSLNKTVGIDFIAQIKNLEQNVKQQNINKTMILTDSLNNVLTCRHLFLHSSHSSTNQTMQNIYKLKSSHQYHTPNFKQ